jgi:hypothetical protein
LLYYLVEQDFVIEVPGRDQSEFQCSALKAKRNGPIFRSPIRTVVRRTYALVPVHQRYLFIFIRTSRAIENFIGRTRYAQYKIHQFSVSTRRCTAASKHPTAAWLEKRRIPYPRIILPFASVISFTLLSRVNYVVTL